MTEKLNLNVGDKVIVRSTNPKIKQRISVIQSVKSTFKPEVRIYKVDGVLYDNFGNEVNPREYNIIIPYSDSMYKTKHPCMNLWYKNTKIATDVENEPGKCMSILRDLDYITSEEIIQIMDAILNNATIVLNDWVLCIDAEYAINNDYDPYDFVDGNCHSDDSCVDCKAAEFCSFKHTGKNNL